MTTEFDSDQRRVTTSSPASSGPAGSHFEGQVGAHYLLTMLIGAEPRGLPGTTLVRIEFQRAAEGHPLDDIIVHAHDRHGNHKVLELQVKRSVTFAPSDPEFRAVVEQVARASQNPNVPVGRHELAVAIARSSRKIDGPYQEVLNWARRLGSHDTFCRRINRPGSANDNMRTFVKTFQANLHKSEFPHDKETVHRLLSCFQILPFDYTALGSAFNVWDEERAAGALHSDDAHRTGDFRKRLIELATESASSGGDLDRARLGERLQEGSFRLAGVRQYATTRLALAEASRHALDDINDQVGPASLFRTGLMNAVRSAVTQGRRYVEIRGDAGVGKSALLKHTAQQLATEAPIIMLSPRRTTGGGWTKMRSGLSFGGTARDLLVDLAGSGGATLFLDGLDFFTEKERLTVKDLVREVSEVPGFEVIATARRDFGLEEPNWLPEEALERLGQADPVMVGELSTAEVSELQAIAPELGALLAESHPARAVTRNLFRLSRLANRPGDGQVPRTEVDMAEQWWTSADGAQDATRLERARVLKELAEQTLAQRESLETASHPTSPLDELIQSQTLRVLGHDRMAFYHDVLRDWAVANLLYSHPDTRDRLPLKQPAPASLVRGVELAARMVLERHEDDSRWRELLDELSHEDAHGSWRRAVLLAPVRSEIDIAPLETVSQVLLADHGRVLRELIGTVLAVDGRAVSALAADGIDVPEHPSIPAGPSWVRLISWLLTLGEEIPPKAIPDIARLYKQWCDFGVGLPRKPSDGMKHYDGLFVPDGDKIRHSVLKVLHRWLAEIETSRYPDDLGQLRLPFRGELSYDQADSLETTLRTSFLTLCYLRPSLASEYVKSLLARGRQAHGVKLNVIGFPGALPYAAPDDLAHLAIAALLPDDEEKTEHRLTLSPFLSSNYHFCPPSPDRGPFIDLLMGAPNVGLRLVRQIVDYAVSYYTRGKSSGASVVSLPFPDGARTFPWPQTYPWVRASQRRDFCVTSALMALSKWGKHRIENGQPVNAVLADVLGGSDTPAAFLLVAVDLLINHWPASRESAIPFLACAELLCLDHRLVWNEHIAGRLRSRILEDPVPRAASFCSLVHLLGDYAVSGPPELRERLVSLLRAASERLGPYGEESSLNDPGFMAFHALNRLDPSNWKQATENPTGATESMEYVAPETECRHLARLEDQSRPEIDDANLRAAIMVAVEDVTLASSDLAAAAVKWAQQAADESADHRWVVTASALLVVRDGDDDVRARNEAWSRMVFADVIRSDLNPLYEAAHTLSMNPAAIAFVGITHLLENNSSPADIRVLLDLAARKDCAATPGFAGTASTLERIDERLPRAILRTAFASCIRPRDPFLVSEDQRNALVERHQRRVQSVVEAELAWLSGNRSEPEWPPFTRQEPRININHGIAISRDALANVPQPPTKPPPDEYVDHSSAARWLNSARSLFSIAERRWLRQMAQTYASWTAVANGYGLGKHDHVDVTDLGEWNDSYFRLLAYCLPVMDSSEVDEFALKSLTELPDSAFVSITEQFLLHIDNLYFKGILPALQAEHIRSVLIDRLIDSDGWEHGHDKWMSIEVNLGRLVARMFMHDGWTQPPRCYLHPDGVDRVDPLLPALEQLAVSGPCFFVALNVLEVDPRPSHLRFIVAVAEAWLKAYPDNSELWCDQLIGRRICGLVDSIRGQGPPVLSGDENLRKRIDRVLVSLTSLGVTEAAVLEQKLANADT